VTLLTEFVDTFFNEVEGRCQKDIY